MTLHDLLMPAAMVILLLSFAFFFWHQPRHPLECVKHVLLLFLLILLITQSGSLITGAQAAVKDFVEQSIPARPDNVAARYRQLLAQSLNSPDLEGKSFARMLFSSNFFEAVIFAVLWLVSVGAMVLQYQMYLYQKIGILLLWSVSAPLLACFSIPPLANQAWRLTLRLISLTLWPVGLALMATVTDGLLTIMVDQKLFADLGVVGSMGRGLQNGMALFLIALWVWSSTILAPVVIGRLVNAAGGAVTAWIKASEVMVTIGLPLLAGVVSWLREGSSDRPAPNNEPSAPARLRLDEESSPPPETPLGPHASDNDPTAEGPVNEILESLKEED